MRKLRKKFNFYSKKIKISKSFCFENKNPENAKVKKKKKKKFISKKKISKSSYFENKNPEKCES